MANWFKTLLIPTGLKEELVAYESWIVRWQSRYDEYSSSIRPEAEVFTNKEDADKFAEQLREAFKLVRHTHGTRVTVKQNN